MPLLEESRQRLKENIYGLGLRINLKDQKKIVKGA